ncbi:MAG: SigE family RNA polymerase sigma factor [Acidimicrobiales bacterium]|nr:SigE family RNA polymerase sigma factor [Acidimicrobiales bacterium]
MDGEPTPSGGTAAVPPQAGTESSTPEPDPEPNRQATTWDDVYLAQRDQLVRLAYLITGSQAVAEDLVQDTFLRVMAKIRADANPGPYLRRSVVNACYSWHRRSWREVRSDAEDRLADRPDSRADGREEGGSVEMWDALSRLAPRRRTMLVLRFYLDMTEADVAAALGCRVGTVKSTTHRALSELKRMLGR